MYKYNLYDSDSDTQMGACADLCDGAVSRVAGRHAVARVGVGWKQPAGTSEQAAPGLRHPATPRGELFGAQLLRARDAALDVVSRHIGNLRGRERTLVPLFGLETIESVHVANLATRVTVPSRADPPLRLSFSARVRDGNRHHD